MNLYNVLLVDDEEEVFQVMIKKVGWEDMGFHVAGYARNGEEALEMAESLSPDVVMTDIKMPYMDGLTLCKRLKELYGNIKVIIFSGFDEFEYAKEAIKIEAEEYILKPINATELQDVFERIKSSLDKELNEKKDIESLRQYYLKSLPMMQEQFFISLLEGRIRDDKVIEYQSSYQIEFDSPYYAVTLIHLDLAGSSDEIVPIRTDPELAMVSLKNFIDENLSSNWNFKSINYLGDIVVIAMLESDSQINDYTDAMDKICRYAKRILGLYIIAGIGGVCDKMMQINHSFEGAKNAMSYRMMYIEGQAINITEIEPIIATEFVLDDSAVQAIIKEIKVGEKENLNIEIGRFMEKIRASKLNLSQYRIVLMELITEFYKLGGAYQLNMDEIFDGVTDIYEKVLSYETLEKVENWILEISIKIRSCIRKERIDSAKLLINRAEEFLNENYGNAELSIETICRYLNVSAAYFSTMFKKETGKTFINYLTELRMERAIQLLNTTEEKTYVISEKVGYSEPNYFSYVFKKQYGISPSKYRMSQLEKNENQN